MPACKSCGARMRWETTLSGRSIPLDPEPVPDGNFVILDEGRVALLAADAETDEPRYKSHFATCPNAAEHRRR